MEVSREALFAKADEFQALAAAERSAALRCRYLSLSRYWSILASEFIVRDVGGAIAVPVHPSPGRDLSAA